MFYFKKIWMFSLVMMMIICGCSSEATKKAAEEKKKAAYFEKGKNYYEKGDYASAKIELQNALKMDPKYEDAMLYSGRTYIKLNDPKEAFIAFRKLETLKPDNIEAKTILANFFFLGKKFDDSEKRISAVLQKEPKNLEMLFLKAAIS